jgi:hypothetical protein
LEELDTITDFVDYLNKKQDAIRSMASLYAAGEEDVIAYYLTHTNSNGDHDITHPEGKAWDSNEELFIIEGTYAAMRKDCL